MKRLIVALVIATVSVVSVKAQVTNTILNSSSKFPYPDLSSQNPVQDVFWVDLESNYEHDIHALDLILKADFGNKYTYGFQNNDYDFDIELDITISFYNNLQHLSGNDLDPFTIHVTNAQPEALFHKEITNLIDDNLIFNKVKVAIVQVGENATELVKNNLRITTKVTADIGENLSSSPYFSDMGDVSLQIQPDSRQAELTWYDDYKTKLYEVQLLKVEHLDIGAPLPKEQVRTKIDWNKAVTYELKSKSILVAPNQFLVNNGGNFPDPTPTPGNLQAPSLDPPVPQVTQKKLKFPIAEGQGVYICRFRAMSSLADDGFRHEKHFSKWSIYEGDQWLVDNDYADFYIDASAQPAGSMIFYYDDPDKDINWSHDLFFDESHSPKESVTYATSLTTPTQTTVYLPSEGVTLVTNQIKDFQGRALLSTVPVPLQNSGKHYRHEKGMVIAPDNGVYNANNFDADENYNSPEANKDHLKTGYYYNNPDPTIANTEGYPFTRNLLDNQGRTVETSGIGKTYAIGDQADGKGRTTRTYYSMPSEEELIMLFGDEAPKSEQIKKVISVDPNNVATVSYINLDDKPIATCLAFYDQVNPGLLPVDENSSSVTVTDEVYRNEVLKNGFRSNKKVVFTEETTVHVDYSIKCNELENICTVTQLDCDFTLYIRLYELDQVGNVVDTLIREFDLGNDNAAIQCQPFGNEEMKVIPTQTFVLQPLTNYIIEKELIFGDPQAIIAANGKNVNLQTAIAIMVGDWLSLVTCEEMLPLFWDRLEELASYCPGGNNNDLENFPIDDPNFPANAINSLIQSDIYLDEQFKGNYSIYFLGDGPPYSYLVIDLPCCDPMEIEVLWLPDICSEDVAFTDHQNDRLPTPYYEGITGNTKETEVDFEGLMIAFLKDLDVFQTNDEFDLQKFNNFMYHEKGPLAGWNRPGVFNMMVHQMLKDKYDCSNSSGMYTEQEEDTYVDGCGNVKTKSEAYGCDANGCNVYLCSDLVGCWTSTVRSFRDILISDNLDLNFGTPTEEFEQNQETVPGGMGPDSPYEDSNIDGEALNSIFEDSGLQEAEQNSSNLNVKMPHLVEEFFNCTGYKFAKIITPLSRKPESDDRKSGYPYSKNPTNDYPDVFKKMSRRDLSLDDFLNDPTNFISSEQRYYFIALDWYVTSDTDLACDLLFDGECAEAGNLEKPLFTLISNPLFAYKYYHYDMKEYQLPLETIHCFRDPNDCYVLDGNGKIEMSGGKPVYTECCTNGNTLPQNDPFCYPDYDYPGLENMEVGDPGVYEGIGGEKFKYIVNEFCGEGRMKCPYDHEDWDCGQRFSFYLALKNMPVMDPPTPPINAPVRDCGSLSTAGNWYWVPSAHDIVSTNELNYMLGVTPELIHSSAIEINDGQGGDISVFNYFDFKIQNKVNICNSNCEQRRHDIRNELVQLFADNCYDVGGCYDGSNEAVVTNSEIDQMVDQLVQACKDQCGMTSYGCQEIGCRSVIAKGWDDTGETGNAVRIEYGMAGSENGIIGDCDGTTYTFDDAAQCGQDLGSVTGLQTCPLKVGLPGVIPEEPNYSWFEYTMHQQANSWAMELSIPSMCPGHEGEMVFSCCPPGVDPTTGDTYLERSEYEKAIETNVPVSEQSNNKTFNAYSPAKTVTVDTQP